MNPTNTDSTLRMTEGGAPGQTLNGDDVESRESSPRSTILDDSSFSTKEEDETLQECLKIYNEHKLNEDNAWTDSVIDTFSRLLDKRHKSVNNLNVASCLLEASSKVYARRVDSIHEDAMRMSSRLNMLRFSEQDEGELPQEDANVEKRVEYDKGAKKRVKKTVRQTVTRNKETINGPLDTNPLTDLNFANLNSIAGGSNSSNRLMQNILHSSESELGLRMDRPFWNSEPQEPISYPEEHNYSELLKVDATDLDEIELEDHVLRPTHTGYIISDIPAEQNDHNKVDFEDNKNNSEMAFDINAEIEPVPVDAHTFVDVDIGELNELTVEEEIAIQNCEGLRRTGVMPVDLRPVDSTSSNLEYSYRPLDKISQFWAGPSHWKFISRSESSILGSRQSSLQQNSEKNKTVNRHVQFEKNYDELFETLNENNTKKNEANIQKLDANKLKLPTDLKINRNVFDVFKYASDISVQEEKEKTISPDIPIQSEYDYDNPDESITDSLPMSPEENAHHNQTIMEITSDFTGAPEKITKIIVPDAKQAKVIDMKQVKECCTTLVNSQFAETEKENIPPLPEYSSDE